MIYALNVGTHKKSGKQKLCKSRLLSCTKGNKNINRVELKITEIETVQIKEGLYNIIDCGHNEEACQKYKIRFDCK